MVTISDFESGRHGSSPEWVPLCYKVRSLHTVPQGLPEPSFLRIRHRGARASVTGARCWLEAKGHTLHGHTFSDIISVWIQDWFRKSVNLDSRTSAVSATCRQLSMPFNYLVYFFIFQYGSLCFCDSSYGRYGKVSDTSCNMACPGATSEMCGGLLLNSVYSGQCSMPGMSSQWYLVLGSHALAYIGYASHHALLMPTSELVE